MLLLVSLREQHRAMAGPPNSILHGDPLAGLETRADELKKHTQKGRAAACGGSSNRDAKFTGAANYADSASHELHSKARRPGQCERPPLLFASKSMY
jgi:hypothetical protein